MLDWIVRLIYLIFLVCKTRHKFVYIYNLYIFFSLYIYYIQAIKKISSVLG